MNDKAAEDLDRQIRALTEIVGTLAASISQLQARVDALARSAGTGGRDDGGQETDGPAAWVWFSPPAAAEDEPGTGDPRFTVDQFVAWYNATYVGADGSRARPIPGCWHHQSRPGFTDRMTRDWTHPDCLDGEHRATGAAERPDRFTLADQQPGETSADTS